MSMDELTNLAHMPTALDAENWANLVKIGG
jgi:hypothetical protein